MKLKIAVLGVKGIPHPGGIELVMEEIGSRLVQRGHQFDIFVRRHYMPEPREAYRGMGLPMSPGVHHKHLDALSHSISAMPIILQENYDVVYINSVGLSVLAWLPRVLGKKVVVHTHGLDWKREKWGPVAQKLIQMSAWTTVKLPHLTFCVCLEDKKYLEETFKSPCIYIPNGIPAANPLKPDEIKKYGLQGKDYFLFMSRLVPEKGAHLLIQAWQQIPLNKKNGLKLVIVGDSNHRDKYYFDLMDFKGADDIIFTGFATGQLKTELLTNALCFVQPSTIEGMPLSILEAIGYERMVLASDIRENKDVLSEFGWFFKSGDTNDLAEKLIQIMGLDEDIVKNAARSLHDYGTKIYNWEIITDRIEQHLINLFK
jgi:glycosyltransferase involved in cell wall biosynthesis